MVRLCFCQMYHGGATRLCQCVIDPTCAGEGCWGNTLIATFIGVTFTYKTYVAS